MMLQYLTKKEGMEKNRSQAKKETSDIKVN